MLGSGEFVAEVLEREERRPERWVDPGRLPELLRELLQIVAPQVGIEAQEVLGTGRRREVALVRALFSPYALQNERIALLVQALTCYASPEMGARNRSPRRATSTRKIIRDVPRPFLKWAGGKGQLVDRLLALAPEFFQAYHEPFLGGGAMFFALHRAGGLGDRNIHLSDVNRELVNAFRAVHDDVAAVIAGLQKHRYNRDHYYSVRAQDPAQMEPAELAARMIFLNKTGFNGLYRVNSRGEFNVPFGRYTNPLFCDRENLQAVSRALRGVELRCEPFEKVLDRARKGDFVYFDPPYVPLSETANFVAYARNGFGLPDQERLADVFRDLCRRGVYVMLSNSDTPWVRKNYQGFRQVSVLVRRSVNSRADRRAQVGELVVLS